MTDHRSGGGDPARTLRLLWRGHDTTTRSRHGPPQGLTIDAVVEAAITLADTEGLPAVTMRRLASTLNVAPMTLYTYVPGKAELLDLMLDTVYARMPRTGTSRRAWRNRLAAIADDNRSLFETHPWTIAVYTIRPPLGPGAIAKYEHELSALDGLGLDDVEIDDTLSYLLSFVHANAQAAAASQALQKDSNMTDQQWWSRNAPLLARVLDEQTYPTAARVGAAAGAAHGSAFNPQHAYEFGLQRILDGLAALIKRRSTQPPVTRKDTTHRTATRTRT